MAEHDRARRWETEALRESAERRRTRSPSPAFSQPQRRSTPPTDTPGLVTLREAHNATGMPIETLRKWARRGHVPSRTRETEFGVRRMIDLEAVKRRAEPPPPPAASTPAPEEEASPSGTMIVPIAAWDRILMQLGNLHEAGRELAEARERAAKAETEATFLRERLAELRAQTERREPTPTVTPQAPRPGSGPPWAALRLRGERRESPPGSPSTTGSRPSP